MRISDRLRRFIEGLPLPLMIGLVLLDFVEITGIFAAPIGATVVFIVQVVRLKGFWQPLFESIVTFGIIIIPLPIASTIVLGERATKGKISKLLGIRKAIKRRSK